MAYGFVTDVPANEEMYGEIRARLGDERPRGWWRTSCSAATAACATSTSGTTREQPG